MFCNSVSEPLLWAPLLALCPAIEWMPDINYEEQSCICIFHHEIINIYIYIYELILWSNTYIEYFITCSVQYNRIVYTFHNNLKSIIDSDLKYIYIYRVIIWAIKLCTKLAPNYGWQYICQWGDNVHASHLN